VKRRGRFIVLEGADGSGKSTQAKRLVAHLAGRGIDVRHVRDPGSTGLSEAVRKLLLDPATGRLSAAAEAMLYMAARAQLTAEVIRPAIESGAVVVCERWTLSTEIYQGRAGGLGVGNVRRLARLASGGIEPDLVLVFDVPVGGGLARLSRARDRMEQKSDAFHADVVRGYRSLSRRRAGFVLLPHAAIDETAARVAAEVDRLVR
jgi:dTMP kinase